MYKWFGLQAPSCETCEVLRSQLAEANRERRELLTRLLGPEPLIHQEEKTEPQPIIPQFVPWKVRQQMLEQEDKKRAQLMREKQNEMRETKISDLERELGVS